MTSESTEQHRQSAPRTLSYAVLSVSDTRTLETDRSGSVICERMDAAGHQLKDRRIVVDEPDHIAAATKELIALEPNVVLVTGGTGLSARDQTVDALEPLFDCAIPGFGELFRMLSFEEIGPAAMLSRATAGRVGSVLVFCLPGSANAVSLAMDQLLVPELPHLVHHALN